MPPSRQRKTTPSLAPELTHLVGDVVAGNVRAIARAISLAESGRAEAWPALADLFRRAGAAHIIGITGVPGSGKSTLVRALVQRFRAEGHKVGIVAIDPSSPFSGGAILGDRVRMAEISGDPGVFIRSMATRGALGGLTAACHEAVDVLDAAGFGMIMIETVGVGQDEVEIAGAAHTVLVVSAPGLGDDVQAIKAGVLEIADIHVVSKADRPDAGKTAADLKGMLGLGGRGEIAGWRVPVVLTSAETGEGIDRLIDAISAHRRHLEESGETVIRRRRILETRILKAAEDTVRARFVAARQGRVAAVLSKVEARALDPRAAAEMLLAELRE